LKLAADAIEMRGKASFVSKILARAGEMIHGGSRGLAYAFARMALMTLEVAQEVIGRKWFLDVCFFMLGKKGLNLTPHLSTEIIPGQMGLRLGRQTAFGYLAWIRESGGETAGRCVLNLRVTSATLVALEGLSSCFLHTTIRCGFYGGSLSLHEIGREMFGFLLAELKIRHAKIGP